MINPERVGEMFLDCLFKSAEIVEGKPIVEPVEVQGVTSRFGLHPQRLESYREEVKSMLQELPASYREGDSFLNLCSLKDGDTWTGLHHRMQELMCLGLGLGYIKHMLPKELWKELPGGMPMIKIKGVNKDA